MTVKEDEAREYRISMEIVVDAYGPEEQALGWYYYLDENLMFPFQARCVNERRISPLRVNEEIKVFGMCDEYDCMAEMFVEVEWHGRRMGVPLSQLEAVKTDPKTTEAITDWHYWVGRGYQLCG